MPPGKYDRIRRIVYILLSTRWILNEFENSEFDLSWGFILGFYLKKTLEERYTYT